MRTPVQWTISKLTLGLGRRASVEPWNSPRPQGLCEQRHTGRKKHGIFGEIQAIFITNNWYFIILFLVLMTYDFISFHLLYICGCANRDNLQIAPVLQAVLALGQLLSFLVWFFQHCSEEVYKRKPGFQFWLLTFFTCYCKAKYSFLQAFIPLVLLEHLLCARHCVRH